MELICTKGKRDSGTKFTSPEFYLPFAEGKNQIPVPFGRGASLGVVPLKQGMKRNVLNRVQRNER